MPGKPSAVRKSMPEVNAYLETKSQPTGAMFDFTYAELPPDLQQQRAAAVALDGKV